MFFTIMHIIYSICWIFIAISIFCGMEVSNIITGCACLLAVMYNIEAIEHYKTS